MKDQTRPYLLFVFFAVLAVYYQLIYAEACSVDDNRMLTTLLNTDQVNLKRVFFPGGGSYYRPVLWLSFLFDKFAWGLQESFMHLENILLHTLNAVLVFLISHRLLPESGVYDESHRQTMPLVAGLLFGLHPINTEAVDWISGRTDVLAGFFLLVSLWCLVAYLKSNRSSWLLPGGISFLLGTLSKDPAVFFAPGAFFLLYVFPGKEPRRQGISSLFGRLPGYLTYGSVAAGYLLLRKVAMRAGDGGIATVGKGLVGTEIELVMKLKLLLKAFGFYVKKLLIPWPLNFAIYSVSNIYIVVGGIAAVGCLFLLWRRSVAKAFILMAVFLILPALLLPLKVLTWTPLAERYLYMPCAFFAIAVPMLVKKPLFLREHARVAAVGLFLVFGVMSLSTFQRNLVWQRNLTLFEDTLKKSPNSPLIRNDYAYAILKEGRRAEAKQILLSNMPADSGKFSSIPALSRANVLLAERKFEEARQTIADKLDPASAIYPHYLELLVRIAEAELETAKDSAAKKRAGNELIRSFRLLREHTGDPFYLYRLGQHYLVTGQRREARLHFEQAYKSAPETAHYHSAAKKLAEKLSQ